MRVKVKNIVMNPFRDLDVCPMDEDKISKLEDSINELGFWNNLYGREVNGVVELAYGAHRLAALQRQDVEEIEISVQDLSDEMMIKIMGQENKEWYGNRTAQINETVKVAKEHIEKEINAKNGVYDDLEPWCKDLFDGESGFKQSMRNFRVSPGAHPLKIGRKIIENFLGDTWSDHNIALALKLLYGETEVIAETPIGIEQKVKVTMKISKDAAEEFEVVRHSRTFIDAITKDEKARSAFFTPESQETLAKEIKEEVLQEQIEDAELNHKKIPKEPKLTSTIIQDKIQQKAGRIIENAIPTKSSYEKEIDKATKEVPEKKYMSLAALKETRKIYNRVEELTYPWDSNVYTKDHVQRQQNMLYMIMYNIQKYSDKLIEDTGIKPDDSVVEFDSNIVPIYSKEADDKWKKDHIEEVVEHLRFRRGTIIEDRVQYKINVFGEKEVYEEHVENENYANGQL